MPEKTDSLQARLIVFTDLDGTLLDHESYSFAAAQQALERLAEARVPLVLASSKTSAEMARLAEALPHRPAALIVENGAGVVWPGEAGAGDTRHAALLAALHALPEALRQGFAGFTDWGPEGVVRETGLPPEEAALAARRDFSEPGLWRGSAAGLADFIDALARAGVTARQGGRFLTLSFGADKADRLREVAARIAPAARILALGDAPNDIGMLEAADIGVIVSNPHGAGIAQLPGETTGQIRRTARSGPAGWNDAVLQVMNELSAVTERG